MLTIHGYFDESGSHAGSPVLCVAGYAFEKREARLLAKEWDAVLREYGLPFFHMVDCAHGNQAYSELSMERRIKLQTSLMNIIKRRAAQGFAVSVDPGVYDEVKPSWAPASSAYAFCARSVIDEMGRWFFQTKFQGKSAFFFEDGHKSRSEADKVVESVLSNPLNQFRSVHYGYQGHSFISKTQAPAVQAADILAWQWATDIKRELAGKPRRKDFISLKEGPIRGAHFDRARLGYLFTLLKDFGVDTQEEITIEEGVRRVQHTVRRSQFALDLLPHRL